MLKSCVFVLWYGSQLSVLKESCQQGEALAGFRWKANPFNEYRFQPSLATAAAAGLLLCTSSGTLRTEHSSAESHSKEEEELYAAPAVLKSLCGVAIQEWEAAAEKIRPSMSSCCRDSKENGMPILKVNALPLSRAHSIGTEPAALKEPSSSVDAFSSRRGDGCLSRYAIADAAAIAAPAVVNVKVSFGKFYLPNTSVLCREAVGILTSVIWKQIAVSGRDTTVILL
jgi:hypothetical protein